MEQLDLSHCFGCGKDNPRGLHLVKRSEGGKAVMELVVDRDHCGFPGMLHGGLSCVMLDEVMCYAILDRGMVAVTLSVQVEFLRPGRQGHTMRVEGWVETVEGRNIRCASLVVDVDAGHAVAKATGSYKVVDVGKFAA